MFTTSMDLYQIHASKMALLSWNLAKTPKANSSHIMRESCFSISWWVRFEHGRDFAWMIRLENAGKSQFPLMKFVTDSRDMHLVRLKKKYFVSKLARIFQTDAACGFLFFILLFFYFNWPLPPHTFETKKDWKVSTSVFSEIKRDFTRFLSSHMLKFFQNSKLSSFFVVKMKKKIISRKKNASLNFTKSNAHRKTNAGVSFETQKFFFSLIKE